MRVSVSSLDWLNLGMRFFTDSAQVHCPYCGESFELIVDTSVGDQSYIEDCYVCCAPIHFSITVDFEGELVVLAQHENDC
mgnify:FL=1